MKFIEEQTAQKLRGGYYTPLDLASFISRWVAELKPERVLEPSCGDGMFFQAMAEVGGFQGASLTGFELDDDEAAKATRRAKDLGLRKATVRPEDFLGWAIDNMADGGVRFDAVVGSPTNFLWFDDAPNKMSSRARQYIERGEREKLHTRYKCRIRAPWFKVPSVYSTEVGMLKRCHNTPRLILNRLGAYTTDTAYRIRTRDVEGERLVGCFINPLTALSAEIEGRHYGGGVLELIPSEIERLLIPLPKGVGLDLAALDASIRNRPTHETLDQQGKTVLGALGISKVKQASALEGWRKLRDRRHRTSIEAHEA